MVMRKDERGRFMKLIRPGIGEIIKLPVSYAKREDGFIVKEKYKVEKHYRDFILCTNKYGFYECFTNGELVQNGLCKNG